MIDFSRYDFIILSTQDWDGLPTRKHRWARAWAQRGARVLYIEQQMHWLGWLADLKQQWARAFRWLGGPRRIEERLWVLTLPVVLPFFQMSPPINWLNNLSLLPVIRAAARRLGFEQIILWAYTPHSADFVGRLRDVLAVYECVDEFTASKGLISPRAISRLERDLLAKVDLMIGTAPSLVENKRALTRRTALVPNGAEAEHFAKAADPAQPIAAPLQNLPRPIIGYLGTLQYWIDTALLARIAREHPAWTLALIGPRDLLADMAPLQGLPNLYMSGRVPYADLPGYLAAFDVCLNPYKADEVAAHCSPLKLYEYLATGKPVVSVAMPEAQQFAGLIDIAHNSDDFVSLVEKAVSSNGENAAARMAEAQQHTWARRFEAVCAALEETLLADDDRREPSQTAHRDAPGPG